MLPSTTYNNCTDLVVENALTNHIFDTRLVVKGEVSKGKCL